jgi:hypothetical protein
MKPFGLSFETVRKLSEEALQWRRTPIYQMLKSNAFYGTFANFANSERVQRVQRFQRGSAGSRRPAGSEGSADSGAVARLDCLAGGPF